MARPAEPGRRALLAAGQRLLSAHDGPTIARLSANAVVAEASMSKGAFFQHFPRRRDYVLALHGLFHEQVFAVLNDQLSTLAPGAERLHSCIILYLDFCLSHGETKSYLFDARADSDLSDAVAAMNRRFAALMEDDLDAIGWKFAGDVALLATAAVAETALHERSLGTESPHLRDSLFTVFKIAVTP